MGLLTPPPARSLKDIVTRWSRLDGLDDPDAPDREEKWAYVIQVYRPAMVAYVRRLLDRRPGVEPGEAEDVVGDFIATCVEKAWLSRADRQTTRSFRAFLTTLLRRFSDDYVDRRRAAKRRPPPGCSLVSLEALNEDGDGIEEPAAHTDAFDREWARTLVDQAFDRLAASNRRYARVIAEILDRPPPPPEPGEKPATPVVRTRAKKRFQSLFLDVLRATVARPEDLPDEWAHLATHLP